MTLLKNKEFRNEAAFKRKAIAFIKERYGDDVWGWPPSDRFTRAVPDLIFCIKGLFFAIELKNGQTKNLPHEKLQDINLDKIERAGGIALKARTMQDLESHLTNFEMSLENLKKLGD